ncbi:unnamed protein product [Prunus armeniaca]
MANEAIVEEDDAKDDATDEVGADAEELAVGVAEQMAAGEQSEAVVCAAEEEVRQGSHAEIALMGVARLAYIRRYADSSLLPKVVGIPLSRYFLPLYGAKGITSSTPRSADHVWAFPVKMPAATSKLQLEQWSSLVPLQEDQGSPVQSCWMPRLAIALQISWSLQVLSNAILYTKSIATIIMFFLARDWLGIGHIFEHICGVLVHGELKVVHVESLLGKQSASSVIPTFAIVYYVEHFECLRVLDASEMRTRVSSANKFVVLHVVPRNFLLDCFGLRFVIRQVRVHQAINDGILPARILVNLHKVRLLYLFNAWLVKIANFLIDSSFAKCKPVSNGSYSALLFEVRKSSVIACSSKVPSGVIMTMPAPTSFSFNALSMCNYLISLVRSSSTEEFMSALELSLFLLTNFSSHQELALRVGEEK